MLRPVYDFTRGVDGRVSIEVDPGLARDTAATVDLAKRLWARVDRPNLLIKIPATVEGLPAITAAIGKSTAKALPSSAYVRAGQIIVPARLAAKGA